MKNLFSFVLFLAFIVGLYGFAFSAVPTADPAGKKAFADLKCATCHSVTSQGVESKKKDKAVDLSNVGGKLKVDFLKNYLNKKEKLDGKPHPSAFKGDETQMKDVVEWLASLKSTK